MQTARGEHILVAAPECSFTITRVEVSYYEEDEDPSTYEAPVPIWSTEAVDAGRKGVTLLAENDGYISEFGPEGIDTGRDVLILWEESFGDGDAYSGSAIGVLDDVQEDTVLWFDGAVSRSSYDWETAHPLARIRC